MPAEPMTAAATEDGAVWLPPADAAALLGLSVRALQKRALAGRLTRRRVGRRSLYRVSLADALDAAAADRLAAAAQPDRRRQAEQAADRLADLLGRADRLAAKVQAAELAADRLAAKVQAAELAADRLAAAAQPDRRRRAERQRRAEQRSQAMTITPSSTPTVHSGKRVSGGEPLETRSPMTTAGEAVRRLYAAASAAGHGGRMVATVDAIDRAARGPVSVEALAVSLVYAIQARLAGRLDSPGGSNGLADDLQLIDLAGAVERFSARQT